MVNEIYKNKVIYMKESIQPKYKIVKCVCACGAEFEVGTTKNVDTLRVDICSQCHPYYTGKQKVVDTGGRVDKFNKRFNRG